MDVSQKITKFFTGYPRRTFDPRQLILRAEDPLPGVFFVVDGLITQYDISQTGNEVVVNIFKPGAFFPMLSAINASLNHYFFEAKTKVVVHLAPVDDVVQFLKANPDVMFDLLTRVYRGVDGVLRRMAHLMGGDAKSRLLFEILNSARRFGEEHPNGTVSINVSEGDLAKRSGLARETVNRVMQDLKTAGIVTVSNGGIIIKSYGSIESQLGANL
jgi:CRP-like cAMP-binding protein